MSSSTAAWSAGGAEKNMSAAASPNRGSARFSTPRELKTRADRTHGTLAVIASCMFAARRVDGGTGYCEHHGIGTVEGGRDIGYLRRGVAGELVGPRCPPPEHHP